MAAGSLCLMLTESGASQNEHYKAVTKGAKMR